MPNSRRKPVKVCLVAIPDATMNTLSGMYEVLTMSNSLIDGNIEFQPEIVSSSEDALTTAFGLPIQINRTIQQVHDADIIIIPSVILKDEQWEIGRYPELIHWLKQSYQNGATLCSACSGVMLLAETGLLDGEEATLHWAYKEAFETCFPKVNLRLEEVLVISGTEQRFVMSGAAASWHDLLLLLISRYYGPHEAMTIAKFFLMQWHKDGQQPYMIFQEKFDHDDGVICDAQRWMKQHLDVESPVELAAKRSGLNERSFKRRFKKATGYTPIAYIQHLRIEIAKHQLESSASPVDDISYDIGYQEPAFFRRLFKRMTGMTPSAYRKKFRSPLINMKHHP